MMAMARRVLESDLDFPFSQEAMARANVSISAVDGILIRVECFAGYETGGDLEMARIVVHGVR